MRSALTLSVTQPGSLVAPVIVSEHVAELVGNLMFLR